MNKSPYLVSVILPVYNAKDFLSSCLDSLINQTHKDIEIIAIDDFSKDGSYKILRTYKKQDARIRIYRNKKRYGLAVCYNRALKRAKGQFICLANPNDINSLHRIKRQLAYLLNHPKVVAVGTQYVSIDHRDKKIAKSNMPEEHETIYQTLLRGISMHFDTVMINKRLLPKDLLRFEPTIHPFIYTEVFIKLFQYGKVANLMQHLYYSREASNNGKRLTRAEHLTSMAKLWLKSAAEYNYRPALRAIFFPRTFINSQL